MYLYISLDLTYTTSQSGINVPDSAEFANIFCDGCGLDNLVVTSIGQTFSQPGGEKTYVNYDAEFVCLDCENRFMLA